MEALASLAEPGVAERILDDVLYTERLDGFPEDPHEFRVLLEGPIYRAVWQWLGDDAAASLVEQLEPTIEMATSHLRSMRVRRESEVHAKPSRPAAIPTVALLSFDEPIAADLTLALDGRAQVRVVELTMELVAAIERGAPELLVVVDDEATPIDAETVEWIGGMVDATPPIVLWGVDADRFNAIQLVAPSAREWVRVESRDPQALAAALDGMLATLEP